MSGSLFMPTSVAPSQAEPDPNKHVNYVLGMVLGVDDFTQEFAYLSGRDTLAAREVGGYGTVRGLRVTIETDNGDKGPEVVVSAGVALTPQGQFVRVPLTQCALLNEWIARNQTAMKDDGVSVPDPSNPNDPVVVSVHVVLSYREQTTDLVPIPGEPCRTEDESMAPSRVTDDFKLELRLDPPEQREMAALLAYLKWLATVPVVTTSTLALPEFLKAITDAAATAVFEPPPNLAVSIPKSDAALYFREAIRLFTTLRGAWLGAGQGADGTPPDEEAVLLAELKVPLVLNALDAGVWNVSSDPNVFVEVDERNRPRVLPISYLQEAMFAVAERAAKPAVTHPLGLEGWRYQIVAAGMVVIQESEPDEVNAHYNGLAAWESGPGQVSVKFKGAADPKVQYIVKALPVASLTVAAPTISFGSFLPTDPLSFTLRVHNAGADLVAGELHFQQLMIEVSAFATP